MTSVSVGRQSEDRTPAALVIQNQHSQIAIFGVMVGRLVIGVWR